MIQFLLRFQHSVSHQPFPLRPSSPYPQPNEVILHLTATSSHGVLQPFAASPTAPTAAHPPFFSYATPCQTPGPPLQPPTAAASPFTTICIPLWVTGTEPQPLPLRWFCREDTDPLPRSPISSLRSILRSTISLGCTLYVSVKTP